MITVISRNRPLTHAARKALDTYGIKTIRYPNELGHWTEVDLAETPPSDVLDRHELVIDRDPDRVFQTPNGETITVYSDAVYIDSTEATISPQDAINHAETNDWEERELCP